MNWRGYWVYLLKRRVNEKREVIYVNEKREVIYVAVAGIIAV